MIKLSNSKFMKILTKLFVLAVIAKAISIALLWYLPSEGINIEKNKSIQPKYSRVNFKNMGITSNTTKKTSTSTTDVASSSANIKTLVLKGLYGKKTKGFIIIAKKSTPKKTTIVEVGEVFEGYKLKYINLKDAILTKDSTEYKINLEKMLKPKLVEQITSRSNSVQEIQRKDIKKYVENPSSITKDISIKDFKVTRVNPKSIFGKLGLKKGDKLVKVNNKEVKRYSEVMEFYKNMDKLDIIQIVVMRNNLETELIYEIN